MVMMFCKAVFKGIDPKISKPTSNMFMFTLLINNTIDYPGSSRAYWGLTRCGPFVKICKRYRSEVRVLKIGFPL